MRRFYFIPLELRRKQFYISNHKLISNLDRVQGIQGLLKTAKGGVKFNTILDPQILNEIARTWRLAKRILKKKNKLRSRALTSAGRHPSGTANRGNYGL